MDILLAVSERFHQLLYENTLRARVNG